MKVFNIFYDHNNIYFENLLPYVPSKVESREFATLRSDMVNSRRWKAPRHTRIPRAAESRGEQVCYFKGIITNSRYLHSYITWTPFVNARRCLFSAIRGSIAPLPKPNNTMN